MGDDAIYDTYLDACVEGRVRTPDSFFEEHPEAGPVVRQRVAALHGMLLKSAPDEDDDDEHIPFEQLGEYRLLRRLDAGGMGSVFLAEQTSLERVIALKIIRPELQGSREATRRFEREAQAVARLRHPNIVTVHGAGTDHGVSYLAMELVEGRRLDDVLAGAAAGREALPVPRMVRWIAQLARALAYAHDHGVVHRDVKPSNIRITPDDQPLLLDFGVAHFMGQDDGTLTRTFAGSPTYAAPEQIAPGRGDVDGRTDVYALGVTLYQCLTGVVPFTGDTVEQVFHRTLTEDPTPPRRLKHAVGRDLEVVALKAMEKSPGARFGSATEFADDLEAILDFRPIRAKPPGPVANLYKLARRHPAAAVGVAAVLILGVVLAGQRWAAERQRHAEARGLVADARTRIATYREERTASVELENKVSLLLKRLEWEYFEPEQDRLLGREEANVARLRRRREAAFYEVLDLLRRAGHLDPDLERETEAVRAGLYLEKWEEAHIARDPAAIAFYRQLVEDHDPDGRFADRLHGWSRLAVASDPPGAAVFLFRDVEQAEFYPGEGERRLVPVPVGGGEPPVRYGTQVLRVVRGAGEIASGDLILATDAEPGKKAVIYRAGATREVVLPEGLVVRTTAAPLFVSPAARIGTTPTAGFRVEAGTYLLLLRHEGHEDLRFAMKVRRREDRDYSFRLNPAETTRDGFVHVPADPEWGPDFWIMEREVTSREYLEFLNDPQTLAKKDAANELILVPRDAGSWAKGGAWRRGSDGRYRIAADWTPDWPVLGVSWHDARAYARWASARSGVAFALPTITEWRRAGGLYRAYPFGNVFRPKWTNSNWSRRSANPEPVLRYPVDESPYGVYDMTGNAREWLESWYDEKRGLRWLAGSSWGRAEAVVFKLDGGNGQAPAAAGTEDGFRLVYR